MQRRERFAAAAVPLLLWPAALAAQSQASRRALEPVAEAMWGELVARDAAVRAAGVVKPPPNEIEDHMPPIRGVGMVGGEVRITPLSELEQRDEAAGAAVLQPTPLAFAAPAAGATTATNGLADLALQDDFAGLLDNLVTFPPDTMGAVGLQHLMVMLNTEVFIQTRDGSGLSKTSLDSFFSFVGLDSFDPRVVYDSLSNRFIAVAVDAGRSPDSAVLLAVSATSDPTGMWRFFRIDADAEGDDWVDFPDVGVNDKWIGISGNMFRTATNTFSGAKLWVVEKDSALAPVGPLFVHEFPQDFSVDAPTGVSSLRLRIAQTHDAGEEALHCIDYSRFFNVETGLPLIRISRITGPVDAPTWSTMPGSIFGDSVGLFESPVAFSSRVLGASQLGDTRRLDTNTSRMLEAEFRNGRLWATGVGGLPPFTPTDFDVDADRTVTVWLEIDPTNTASPFVQGGVLAGAPDEHFFYPSIAVNRAGDMLLGFSHSSPSVFARSGYAGRLASDPPGALRAPVFYKAGRDSYFKTGVTSSRNRWGDYSATMVDPRDERTFWTIQEYAEIPIGVTSRWGTHWARVGTLACPEDHDGDNAVGPGDLLAVLAGFGAAFAPDDLLAVLGSFGADCP